MIRAGVVGRRDALRLAPWLVLGFAASDPPGEWVEVLFAVVDASPGAAPPVSHVAVRRYRFEVGQEETGARTMALSRLWRHTMAEPAGVEVCPADTGEELYRPPLDVVRAAEMMARDA